MIKKDIYYYVSGGHCIPECFCDYTDAQNYVEDLLDNFKANCMPDKLGDVVDGIDIFECKKIMSVVKTGTIKIPKTVEYIEVDDYDLVGV